MPRDHASASAEKPQRNSAREVPSYHSGMPIGISSSQMSNLEFNTS